MIEPDAGRVDLARNGIDSYRFIRKQEYFNNVKQL